MTLPKLPRDHVDLLLRLNRRINTEAFEEIKVVVQADEFGGFLDAELEKITNMREMLRKLEAKGVIGIGKYSKLKEIMRSIENISVIEDIERTEELLYEKGYRNASQVSNAEMTSEPHQSQASCSGYRNASQVSNAEMTSEPHQSQASCSGYRNASQVSNAEMMSEPRQSQASWSGETVDGPLQAAVKVEQSLREQYMTTGSYVQIIPWVGGNTKAISDIYTKLKLLNTDHQGQQLKSYEDMFLEKTKEGHSVQRIILSGVAGIGKSTLIDKMAYDWANGEKLQEYKLVFILKMFDLEESLKFIDAIFNQLVDENVVSKADLKSYITTNPAKVLILFDGFDEFKTTNVSEISRILNRKIFRNCCVVVTTRPSHFHKLVSKTLIERPFTHVEVLGFNEEDIEQYICRFFPKDHDTAEGLIQKIKFSDFLFDLATRPMLLLLMFILWREQSKIPDTMYRLYKDAFRYIFERKQLLPDETIQVVITIGKNALDDLLSPHQFLSFKEGDFEDQALRSALKAGVLTSQRVIKGLDTRHSVSFIHRTFQEYCAAIFFQSLLGTDEEQFNMNLDRVGTIMKGDFQGLEYLLRFCCGDNQSCTNKVLSLIQKCFRQKTMMKNEELLVKCYFEGQFEDLPSVDLVTENMSIEGYSNDGLHALFYYLKHVNADDRKKGGENAQLNKVTSLVIRDCNFVESFGEDLGEAMSGMINLTVFRLVDCKVTPESMKYIASSFVNTHKLTEITISLIDNRPGIKHSVLPWGHNLRSLKWLNKFIFKGCDLQNEDRKYIATSLGLMKNLVYCLICIDNRQNHFLLKGNMGNTDWFNQRMEMTYLLLCSCSLTSSELSDMLSEIKTREDYFSIDLSGNSLLGGLANIWAKHLKNLKHLRQLVLQGCALQSKDIEPLAGSLSDMSTLAALNLSCNPSLGGNAVSWAVHLGQLNQLELEMSLCNCSLTGVDIGPIGKSVGNIHTLDLGGNLELRHSVASWAPSLRHFKHLKRMILTRCDFSCADTTLLCKVQQQMSNTVNIKIIL